MKRQGGTTNNITAPCCRYSHERRNKRRRVPSLSEAATDSATENDSRRVPTKQRVYARSRTTTIACMTRTIILLSLWCIGNENNTAWKATQVFAAERPTVPKSGSFVSSSASLSHSLSFDSYRSESKARIEILSSDIDDEIEISAPEEESVWTTADSLSHDQHRYVPPIVSHLSTNSRRYSEHDDEELVSINLEAQSLAAQSLGIPAPQISSFKKTGTTIAGCVVPRDKDGNGPWVVLAADTRATEGTLVADKRCDKIHKLASNCRCCGAGTSADLDKVTRQVLFHLALEELQGNSIGNGRSQNADEPSTGKASSVVASNTKGTEILYQYIGDDTDDTSNANKCTHNEALLWMRPVPIDLVCRIFQDTLFRNGGQLGANLIVGGVWNRKAYLRAIHPHGSTDVDLPFAALGSGGLAAMAVLEKSYAPSITMKEGIELVQRAIVSGIRNDLGSGSQVDLCVIGPDGYCRQVRGVVPEEDLMHLGGTKDASVVVTGGQGKDELPKELETETADRNDVNTRNRNSGVNGFGNQPFAVERTKQRMVSVEMDHAKRKGRWDKLLGVSLDFQ